MSERIVDILESIEIDHEHGKGLMPAAQASHRAVELFYEQRSIGEAREPVMVGQKANVKIGLLALGDIFMR